jgi:uncharacterized Zn-binding protein involved in type VI secretion
MLTRYLITLGAPTTAGGKVTSASSFRSINGAKAALEGDKVWCPKCNFEGVVGLDGPRLSETCNGRQQALSDDLCLCKCSPSPRLLTAQTFACQKVDADWHAAKVAATAGTAAKHNTGESSATDPYCIPILLLDPATDEPFKHRPYRLELADKVIEGATDQNGATRPLTAAERASVVTWHVDSEHAAT